MKVCTDATLFGAMAPVKVGETVLDIGAGTGLLSLMVAQLGAGQVIAVELTREAFEEASFNAENSPWRNSIHVRHEDVRQYARHTREQFDFIICNPPFFVQHSKSSNALKQLARHTDQLSYGDLLDSVNSLLSRNGSFYVLLPCHAVTQFVNKAREIKLFLHTRVNIRGYARNQPKVAALLFRRIAGNVVEKQLTIYSEERIYSTESEHYLSPFLLRFAPD